MLITPGMSPLEAGIWTLFLVVLGLAGVAVLFDEINSKRRNKQASLSRWKLIGGGLAVVFVICNWIGYEVQFSKQAARIVGKYRSLEGDAILTINSDKSWKVAGASDIVHRSCTWEYVISEDWSYWNVESGKMQTLQIGTPESGKVQEIYFKSQDLIFRRIR